MRDTTALPGALRTRRNGMERDRAKDQEERIGMRPGQGPGGTE